MSRDDRGGYYKGISYLSQISPKKKGWKVFVKILSWWVSLPHEGWMTRRMILCNEIDTMIDAIVPSYVFEHNIPRVLEEEGWFFMEDIHVIKASVGSSPPLTDHKFIIKFLEYTKLSPVGRLVPNKFFQFASFSMIENKTVNSTIAHDAYGVVVRVGNITRPDYIPQNSENLRLSQFLEFELQNTWGKSLTCVASRYTCDLFVRLWRELGLDLGYEWTFGMNPTTCVLRFWMIFDHEGRQCLISHKSASRIVFNQTYPEINMARITAQFLERMQPVELGEVVDEN